MNYEQKYKEALERAKTLYENANGMILKKWVEQVFPELAESEDEKIRKMLIHHITQERGSLTNNEAEAAIAWLEKQGEQEYFDYGNVNVQQKDFAPKVEPKFKVGDWVILTAGELSATLQIANVDANKKRYWFNDSSYLPIVDEECLHHWAIQDAKPGDVLAMELNGYSHPFVAIFKEQNGEYFNSHCFVGFNGEFYEGQNGHVNENVHPATKEQRDLLFRNMREVGYEWNAEKKELKKIEEKSTEDSCKNSDDITIEEKDMTEYKKGFECGKQRVLKYPEDFGLCKKTLTTWSEEDECYMSECIGAIATKDGWSFEEKRKTKHWLKSIKERIRG